MAKNPTYLNQYNGTDATGNTVTVVAEDMVTAATIYQTQQEAEPIILQRVKTNVLCKLPEIYVTFNAVPYDETTAAVTNLCSVAPEQYTVMAGTKQIFSAKAGEGYEFVKWQINDVDVEDDSGSLIKDSVAMLTIPNTNRTCNIKAVFKAI